MGAGRGSRPGARLDLVRYQRTLRSVRLASHPTGISRTVLNLADRLLTDPGAVFGSARPLFWHPLTGRSVTVDGSQLSPLRAFFPQWRTALDAADLAATSYSSPAMKAFAGAAVSLLTDDRLWRRQHEAALRDQQGITWSDYAARFEHALLGDEMQLPTPQRQSFG
jgi:hypothetical protein